MHMKSVGTLSDFNTKFHVKKNETFCVVITVCVLQKHTYKIHCNFLKLFALFEAGTGILGNTLECQLQRFYKLVSYERAVKILKNDICITEIGQAFLKIFEFIVEFPRKIPKIRYFENVSIIRVEH